jgi:hypothetical protein
MALDNFILEHYHASPVVARRGDPAFYVNVAKEFGDRSWNLVADLAA